MAGGARTGVGAMVLALTIAIGGAVPAYGAELVAPADGATVSASPTFEWRLGPDERANAVRIARTDSNPDPPSGRPAGDAQSYTAENLSPGAHTWSLSYYDSASRLRETPTRTFTVAPPPLDKLKVQISREFFDLSEFDPEASGDYLENSTEFNVEATPYSAVLLAVRYGKKQVYAATLQEAGQEAGFEGLITDTYVWTCKRQGPHTWTVAAFDAYGGSKVRTGTFTPGRCGLRQSRIRRRDLIGYIEDDFKPDEFVNYIKCRAASKLTSKGAHAWRCVVVWNNFRRECGARYLFRYYEQLRFGQAIDDPIRARRETDFVCAQFAG